jgi:hypothetical protein
MHYGFRPAHSLIVIASEARQSRAANEGLCVWLWIAASLRSSQ